MTLKGITIAVLCLTTSSALAQNVTVIGPVIPGNLPEFNSNTVIKDSGIPAAQFTCPLLGAFLVGTGSGVQCSTVPGSTATLNGTLGTIQLPSTGDLISFTRNSDNFIAANGGSAAVIHLQINSNNICDITATGAGCNYPFSITPPAGANTGLTINQQPTGTGVVANCSGCVPANTYSLNLLNLSYALSNDNIALATPGGFVNGLSMVYNFGGSAVNGGRQGALFQLTLNGATNASNPNRNYASVVAYGQAATGDGGTGTSFANAKGAIFGLSGGCFTYNGATNLLECTGGEINVQMLAGSSSVIKALWSLIPTGADAVQGSIVDAGLVISAQTGAVGINNPILICDCNGQMPATTTATLFGGQNINGGTWNVANGVDMSPWTFSGKAFKSNAFSVDQSGNIVANTLNKVTITAPGTAATLTLANNSSLITSGAFSATFTFTNTTTVTFPTSGTLATTAATVASFSAGTTGLTPNSATIGAVTLGGTLNIANGGTGQVTAAAAFNALSPMTTAGDIIYGGASGVGTRLAAGSGTQVLLGGTAPSWGQVTSLFLNITPTTCTNQFMTALSTGGVGTCTTDTLASAQHANQGTTTTVLHGNAAGNPSWTAVSLSADVTGSLALSSLATQATNTVVGNATSGSAAPTALSMTSCSSASSAVIWTTNTGFGCNTSITAAAVPASGLTGATLAAGVTASSLTSLGTITTLTATTINAFTAGGSIAMGGNSITNALNITGTNVTAPNVYGSSAAGGSLIFGSTTNGSPSGDAVFIRGSNLQFQDALGSFTYLAWQTTSNVYQSCTNLATNSGAVVTCTVSAKEFKNQLGYLPGSFDKIDSPLDALHPAIWTYKDAKAHDDLIHVGLYADDVAAMDKRCGTYVDGKVKGYEDRCVIAYLVANMRKMESEIEVLKRR